MTDPRIYLAIDNCFASKRWTQPSEWLTVIRDIGVYFVEASADNECDPLYTTPEYMTDWINDVLKYEKKTGVKVANLYSGHGTYATTGLAHTDSRIRNRMLNDWLKPMAGTASKLSAGMGFFCHAFSDSVLQDPAAYDGAVKDLYENLASVTAISSSLGIKACSVEQMYTPHQIPWTVNSTRDLIKTVFGIGGNPIYITLDTGHQTGQRQFLRPSYDQVKKAVCKARAGTLEKSIWLGTKSAHILFEEIVFDANVHDEDKIQKILSEMEKYPYLFADYSDGNTYTWIEKLACWSPIIHLQQTDGMSSSHKPFDDESNSKGVIRAEKVLAAIARSYQSKHESDMPPLCNDIYLTLEIFSGTAEKNDDILRKLKKSVEYWREFIPKDGMHLSQILNITCKERSQK